MAGEPVVSTPITTRHWLVVTGSGLLMSLNVMSFVAIGILLPRVAESLGLGLGQTMLFVSVSQVAGAIALTAAGPRLLVRLGAQLLSLVGGLVTGVAFIAVSLVDAPWQLFLLAAGTGVLAPVSLQMTGAALVNDWFLARRGLMQGLVMGVASIGGITAGVVLPAVVGSAGWRAGFAFVGATTIVVTIGVVVLMLRNHPADVGLHVHGAHDVSEEEHLDAAGLDAGVAARTPAFAALMLGLICFVAIMSFQQHFASIMAERGLDLTAAGSLLSILSLVSVATTLLLGVLSDRRGPVVACLLAGVLTVASLLCVLLAPGYAGQLVGVLLLSLPAITPPIMAPILLRASFGGRAFLPLLGAITATMPVGIAIGSPLWGLAKDTAGTYDGALWFAVGLAVASILLVTWAVRSGGRQWRRSPEPELLAGP